MSIDPQRAWFRGISSLFMKEWNETSVQDEIEKDKG